jgi:hypothetical protein
MTTGSVRVQDRRVAACLQAHHGRQAAPAGEPRHLFRLGEIRTERPLAEHGLSGLEAGHDQVPVAGHPHADDDEVDVRVRRHVAEPVERARGPERGGRGLGGVGVRGADRLELVVGQGLQRGDVGTGPPAAAPRGDGCPHDADANLVRHLILQEASVPGKRAYAWTSAPNALLRSVTVWRDRVQRPPHRHAFAVFASSGVAQRVTVSSSPHGWRTAYWPSPCIQTAVVPHSRCAIACHGAMWITSRPQYARNRAAASPDADDRGGAMLPLSARAPTPSSSRRAPPA